MSPTTRPLLMRNSVFGWLAAASALAVLLPLLAMQFTEAVQWSFADFIAMAALLFGAASVFVLVARRLAPGYRLAVAVVCALGALYVWAELAVGVFTRLGH